MRQSTESVTVVSHMLRWFVYVQLCPPALFIGATEVFVDFAPNSSALPCLLFA